MSENSTVAKTNAKPNTHGNNRSGGVDNPAFPPELMKRRWSKKEILNIVCEELNRNGKLVQTLTEVFKGKGMKK